MTFLKTKFPYFIIGLTVAIFFSLFLFETFNYSLIKDDVWYKDLLSKKGIINAAMHMYMNVNGRWFSHLWDSIVFKLFLNHYQLLFIYHLFLLSLNSFFRLSNCSACFLCSTNTFYKDALSL